MQVDDATFSSPRLSMLGNNYLDEIDAVHSTLARHQTQQSGVTRSLMYRLGDVSGTRVDYSALRAEAQQRSGRPAPLGRSPRG